MSDEGFFARWSRRKVEGVGVSDSPHPNPLPGGEGADRALTEGISSLSRDSGRGTEGEGGPESTPPPPTLDDVAQLTPASDFSRFVAPDVADEVKQAAMKKLFADPHFNVMDGLDTYIADYGQPDPIPETMLRRMVQSTALGLFDHEEKDEAEPKASPDGAAPQPLSKSPSATDATEVVPADEDPDLRLQQDDAAGPGGTDESAGTRSL